FGVDIDVKVSHGFCTLMLLSAHEVPGGTRWSTSPSASMVTGELTNTVRPEQRKMSRKRALVPRNQPANDPPPGAPRSAKGAKTRARRVEAANLVSEETGFLDARISDIAERAGISHGSFYHYFESKEQIFRE